MIQSKEGLINIDKAFGCRNCKTLVYEPFITQCCELVICNSCIKNRFKCPKCQNQCKYMKSNLLQEMFKYVYVDCPFDCKTNLAYFQLQKHKSICPEATIECPYCKKTPKIRLIPQHLGEDHIEECNRMLNEFQKQKENKMPVEVSQNPVVPKIQPFKHGTTGEFNIDPRLSRVGRIVCGNILPQPLISSSFSGGLFSSKNRQTCSIQHGSCDRCMELDVQRLGLPKNYLLNLQGRICCFLPQKRKVACGCMRGKVCNEQIQCSYCRKTLDLIERGFYKKCF